MAGTGLFDKGLPLLLAWLLAWLVVTLLLAVMLRGVSAQSLYIGR